MKRSILAVVAGYLTTVVITTTMFSFVMFALFGGPPPDDFQKFQPPAWLYALELGTAPIIGAIGGYVCAWIARKQEMKHALILVGVMIVFGAISVATESGMRSPWWSVALTLLVSVGAVGGARVRAARR